MFKSFYQPYIRHGTLNIYVYNSIFRQGVLYATQSDLLSKRLFSTKDITIELPYFCLGAMKLKMQGLIDMLPDS